LAAAVSVAYTIRATIAGAAITVTASWWVAVIAVTALSITPAIARAA
jgi:hypothetical protein